MRETLVKTEEFKDSPVEKIPKDWEIVSLKNEINILHGYAFEGEYFADEPPGDVLLVPGNFHRDGGLYFDDNNTKYYRGLIPDGTVLENGQLLIVMTDLSPRTLILGRVVLLELPFRVLHNQRIGKIVPKLPNTWDKRFLLLVMNSDTVRRNIISNATGTTVRHTSPDRILANVVPKPPVEEQSKIAEILNTIDEAIAHTSSLIAKLKQMKAGLLHDLLTRGLDENGELRDAIAHPKQFKDSPLGRIPKDWKIYNTGAIATIKYGINDAVDQTLESGVLTITLPCVSKTGELTLDKELLALSARHKVRDEDILQAGDLLFNWRNGSQEHLGKTAYFEATGEYTHVGFLLRIRANPELCDSRYLWWRISYMKSEGFFLRAKSQVNNTFNSEELANMRVIVPPIPEQQRLVKALEPCEQRIRAEEAYHDKLKLQKQGLMHDLLTGKVRVNYLGDN
ncbi:restriction endonuclease subunit S [Funiculus sociatus]|uniref:restriction endonuclease subunit S n=1 Tax=Funiculus sociatus TaxID=450527 RepID=UPI0032976DD3